MTKFNYFENKLFTMKFQGDTIIIERLTALLLMVA